MAPQPTPAPAGAEPRPGAFVPLRYPVFRAIWVANLISNFGVWIQSVAAAWLMTSLTQEADLVALVQAATSLPILLFSLAAGALADIWDRRMVILIAQSWMLTVAVLLAVLTEAGVMTPWLLLFATFCLGTGTAMNSPAWQSSVSEMVPRSVVPSAVALNSVGFNIARSVGPAIGGAVVSLAGITVAFAINAMTYVGLIVVLVRWKRPPVMRSLPPERITSAMIAGLRYAGQALVIKTLLIRCFAFGLTAAAPWALLPLVARRELGGGPEIYGMLLGALGIGAVSGAMLIGPVLRRHGPEFVIRFGTLTFAAVSIVLGSVQRLEIVLLALVFGGAAWLTTLSSFNITVQMAVPTWVKGRSLAIYQMTTFGGMALGSWFWGALAEGFTIRISLLSAAVALLLTLTLSLRFRLVRVADADLGPTRTWEAVPAAPEIDPLAGPVLVIIEYRITESDAEDFATMAKQLGRIRRRDGANHWDLYQDVADPTRWVEHFTIATWIELQRQQQRATKADELVHDRVVAFHRGEKPPTISHLLHHTPHQHLH